MQRRSVGKRLSRLSNTRHRRYTVSLVKLADKYVDHCKTNSNAVLENLSDDVLLTIASFCYSTDIGRLSRCSIRLADLLISNQVPRNSNFRDFLKRTQRMALGDNALGPWTKMLFSPIEGSSCDVIRAHAQLLCLTRFDCLKVKSFGDWKRNLIGHSHRNRYRNVFYHEYKVRLEAAKRYGYLVMDDLPEIEIARVLYDVLKYNPMRRQFAEAVVESLLMEMGDSEDEAELRKVTSLSPLILIAAAEGDINVLEKIADIRLLVDDPLKKEAARIAASNGHVDCYLLLRRLYGDNEEESMASFTNFVLNFHFLGAWEICLETRNLQNALVLVCCAGRKFRGEFVKLLYSLLVQVLLPSSNSGIRALHHVLQIFVTLVIMHSLFYLLSNILFVVCCALYLAYELVDQVLVHWFPRCATFIEEHRDDWKKAKGVTCILWGYSGLMFGNYYLAELLLFTNPVLTFQFWYTFFSVSAFARIPLGAVIYDRYHPFVFPLMCMGWCWGLDTYGFIFGNVIPIPITILGYVLGASAWLRILYNEDQLPLWYGTTVVSIVQYEPGFTSL